MEWPGFQAARHSRRGLDSTGLACGPDSETWGSAPILLLAVRPRTSCWGIPRAISTPGRSTCLSQATSATWARGTLRGPGILAFDLALHKTLFSTGAPERRTSWRSLQHDEPSQFPGAFRTGALHQQRRTDRQCWPSHVHEHLLAADPALPYVGSSDSISLASRAISRLVD